MFTTWSAISDCCFCKFNGSMRTYKAITGCLRDKFCSGFHYKEISTAPGERIIMKLGTFIFFVVCVKIFFFDTEDVNSFCVSPQYVQIRTRSTVNCMFQENYTNLFWYDPTNPLHDNAVVIVQNSVKQGRGLLSGEFDIDDEGSLIINNVTLKHEGNFTVLLLPTLVSNAVRFDVQVFVFAKPSQSYPLIDRCGSSNYCYQSTGEKVSLRCYVRDARPSVNLMWKRETNAGLTNVPSMSDTFGNVTYTSYANMTEIIENTVLAMYVCDVQSDLPMAMTKSMILLEKNITLSSSSEPLQKRFKLSSTFCLYCGDNEPKLFVWKKSFPTLWTIAYSLIGKTGRFTSDFSVSNGALTKKAVNISDKGLYTCLYSNGDDSYQVTYEVDVIEDTVQITQEDRSCVSGENGSSGLVIIVTFTVALLLIIVCGGSLLIFIRQGNKKNREPLTVLLETVEQCSAEEAKTLADKLKLTEDEKGEIQEANSPPVKLLNVLISKGKGIKEILEEFQRALKADGTEEISKPVCNRKRRKDFLAIPISVSTEGLHESSVNLDDIYKGLHENPSQMEKLTQMLQEDYNVDVTSIEEGSIIIHVKTTSLTGLRRLRKDVSSKAFAKKLLEIFLDPDDLSTLRKRCGEETSLLKVSLEETFYQRLKSKPIATEKERPKSNAGTSAPEFFKTIMFIHQFIVSVVWRMKRKLQTITLNDILNVALRYQIMTLVTLETFEEILFETFGIAENKSILLMKLSINGVIAFIVSYMMGSKISDFALGSIFASIGFSITWFWYKEAFMKMWTDHKFKTVIKPTYWFFNGSPCKCSFQPYILQHPEETVGYVCRYCNNEFLARAYHDPFEPDQERITLQDNNGSPFFLAQPFAVPKYSLATYDMITTLEPGSHLYQTNDDTVSRHIIVLCKGSSLGKYLVLNITTKLSNLMEFETTAVVETMEFSINSGMSFALIKYDGCHSFGRLSKLFQARACLIVEKKHLIPFLKNAHCRYLALFCIFGAHIEKLENM